MGKIGDLWVRLGLKNDDYKKGMKDAQKETSSFTSKLGNMKAGALAAWAAIGTAVMKFAKDFIGATNMIGDLWAQQVAALKAVWQTTLVEIANYKPDFSSFKNFVKGEWEWIKKLFGNSSEAADAAKEMTKAFDAEFELVNSVKLQKAMIQQELNDLYIAMRNTMLSPADRKAAAQRYKSLLQPLADAEIRIYQNMLEKASEAWQAGAGLSRKYSTEEIRDFFANYGVNQAATAAKYGELASVYENRKGDTQNQVIYDTLLKLEQATAQMSDVNRVLSRSELAIDKSLSEFDIKLAEDLQGGLEDVYAEIDAIDFSDIEIEMPDIDMSAFDRAEQRLDQFVEGWQEEQQKIAELNTMLGNTFADSISGGVQAFTEMLFDLDNADPSQILAALLEPFAKTAMQLGTMLIAQGTAVEVFKSSLSTLQGAPAIAAGAALIAISTAMTAGIKALGNNAGSATASYASGGEGAGGVSYDTYDSTITVEVVGKISGSDILIAGRNQQNKWNR